MDCCYPIDGLNREKNVHIRRLLKNFFYHESSGRIATPTDGAFNHNKRIKFIRFLFHQRKRRGDTRLQGNDVHFRSLRR